jgi:hypothetical protein
MTSKPSRNVQAKITQIWRREHRGVEKGAVVEGVLRVEENILGLVLYKELVCFQFSRFFLWFLFL